MKTAKDISLTKEEKYAAREQMMSFMKKHPGNVRVAPEVRLHSWRLRNFFIFLTPKSMPAVIIFLVASLSLGGTVAAESAIPGDVLYPVKIHVNEEVRGWLAISDEAQARWDAELAARRLEEAEELALKNKLNAEAQADLSARFEAHVQSANKHIQAVKDDGDNDEAAEIESELSSSLQAHGQVMGQIKLRSHVNESGKSLLNSLSVKVHSRSQEVEPDEIEPVEIDDDETTPPARGNNNTETDAELEARAKISLEQSLDALARIRAQVAATPGMTSAEFEAQIKAAEQALVQGRAHLEAKQFVAANAQFEIASRKVLQAHKFIETMLKLQLTDEDDKKDKDDGAEIPPDYRGPNNNPEEGERGRRGEQPEQSERPDDIEVESRGGIDLGL